MSHDVTIMTCCCFFLLTAHAQTAVKMCADGKCPHRRDCTLWREYALCRLNGAMKRASRRVGPVRRAGTSCVKYSELAQDVLNLAVIKVYNVINEGASGRVYNDYMQYLCNFEVRVYYGEKNEVITIRITAETKKRLATMAREREWSLAQTANKILTEYLDAGQKDTPSAPENSAR